MPLHGHLKLSLLFLLLLAGTVYCLGLDKLNSMLLYNGFDTLSYVEAADALKNNVTFHATRCFAYPLLIFVAQQLAGNYFFYVLYFVQSIMLAMVFYWQYRWLQQITKQRTAFLFAVIGVCTISYYLFAFFILTEIACLFFIAFFFEQIRRSLYQPHRFFIFWAMFSFSVSVLLKPGLLYFGGLLLLVFTTLAILRRFSSKKLLLAYMGFFLPLLVQYNGMYNSYKEITLSYINHITYYRYFNTSVIALKNNEAILPLMEQRDSIVNNLLSNTETAISFPAFSSIVRNEQRALFRNYPLTCLKAYALNLFSNFHTGNTNPTALPQSVARFETANQLFFDITRIENMLYVLALFFVSLWFIVWLTLNRKQSDLKHIDTVWSLLALCFAWYAFLISGVSFYQGDRFNIIWMPFLLPVIATIMQLWSHRSNETIAISQ